MAGGSHKDTATTQHIRHSHIIIRKPFYLEQLLGYGALVDGLTFLLFLSVVGHTDLLQERNRGGDLHHAFIQHNIHEICLKVQNEILAAATCIHITCTHPLVPQVGAFGDDAPSSCLQLSSAGLKSVELFPLCAVVLCYIICTFKGVIVDYLILAV